MWKTMGLCVSLFAALILGLVAGAHYLRPGTLALFAAVGLALVGGTLLLMAPTPHVEPRASIEPPRDISSAWRSRGSDSAPPPPADAVRS
jgi:hypothetical protein